MPEINAMTEKGVPRTFPMAGTVLMCRNIRTLFNFEPPVTELDIQDASLQFVRKICGFTKPSKANEPAFARAVSQVAAASSMLLASLETHAPAKSREKEAAKAKMRASIRFSNANT